MIARIACLLITSILLLACGTDDTGGLPPVRPAGTISGQAVAAAIGNAQVTVYGFKDGMRGARLGGTLTDDSGNYAIDIRAPSQAIVIEISGGNYVEEASGESVALEEGQILRSVGHYESGRPLTLMVTPLTHMAAALAEFKVAGGMAVAQAIGEAQAAINTFFALDVQTTPPAAIAGLPDDRPGAAELYAFYLAGLSHWSRWFAQGDASQWNSIALAQTLYQDLRADGLLDGLGDDPATPLGYGAAALGADAYRLAFSLHMLAFAQKAGIDSDKLLAAAQAMAAQTTLLPDGTDPAPLDGQVPQLTLQQLESIDNEDTLLSLEEFAGKAHSGTFLLQVRVDGLLGAKRLTVSIIDGSGKEIDGEAQEHTLRGSGVILNIVDTTHYDDGEYTFTVSAEDILGKTSVETFRIQFDNTAPTITFTSLSSTNQATATLTGTYRDNIAGLAAIRVDGQEATLFTEGTWQSEVNLEVGLNTFPIEVVDQVGNRRSDLTATLYLDDILPTIDSVNRHGPARLSNGDGSASDPERLLDSNGSLYFESDGLDLGGTLIDRFALDGAGIPYFAFAVSDDTATDVLTASEDITVSMQYRHNDRVLNDWHPLTPVGGEYLIPLTSETLATDWHRARPSDQHIIAIEVSDPAGNTATTQFDFYADIYVPAFDIPDSDIADIGQTEFTATDFADRASLNGRIIDSTAYSFRNTTGKAFYISLGDDSVHTTTQTLEKLVREHRVRLKTTTEWQVGLMIPSNNCPTMSGWTATSSIWNWDGSGWVKKQVPAPSNGEKEELAPDDELPAAPADSEWVDVADFDTLLEFGFSGNSLTQKTYSYDYKLDPGGDVEISAYVTDWTLRDTVTREILKICPQQRYFQQHETYAYELVDGYPKGVLTTETIADTPSFGTTGFTVTDTGAEIIPVGGWYRIPAGHAVTIVKQVTLPALTLYDEDISGAATYTPRRKDKALTWSVDRGLNITTAHDAGEANITDMPQRVKTVGDGAIIYQISR